MNRCLLLCVLLLWGLSACGPQTGIVVAEYRGGTVTWGELQDAFSRLLQRYPKERSRLQGRRQRVQRLLEDMVFGRLAMKQAQASTFTTADLAYRVRTARRNALLETYYEKMVGSRIVFTNQLARIRYLFFPVRADQVGEESRPSRSPQERTRSRAEAILAALQSGEIDFAEAARRIGQEFPVDRFVVRGVGDALLEGFAFSRPPGTLCDYPLQSPRAFHVVQLVERFTLQGEALEKVAKDSRIRALLLRDLRRAWLRRLRKHLAKRLSLQRAWHLIGSARKDAVLLSVGTNYSLTLGQLADDLAHLPPFERDRYGIPAAYEPLRGTRLWATNYLEQKVVPEALLECAARRADTHTKEAYVKRARQYLQPIYIEEYLKYLTRNAPWPAADPGPEKRAQQIRRARPSIPDSELRSMLERQKKQLHYRQWRARLLQNASLRIHDDRIPAGALYGG